MHRAQPGSLETLATDVHSPVMRCNTMRVIKAYRERGVVDEEGLRDGLSRCAYLWRARSIQKTGENLGIIIFTFILGLISLLFPPQGKPPAQLDSQGHKDMPFPP